MNPIKKWLKGEADPAGVHFGEKFGADAAAELAKVAQQVSDRTAAGEPSIIVGHTVTVQPKTGELANNLANKALIGSGIVIGGVLLGVWLSGYNTRQERADREEDHAMIARLYSGAGCPSGLKEVTVAHRALRGSAGPIQDEASRYFTQCPKLDPSIFIKKPWFG